MALKTKSKTRIFDQKEMGPEPDFTGVEFQSDRERDRAKQQAYNWYNYFCNSEENRAYIINYMRDELSSEPNDISAVLKAPRYAIGTSAERLVRMWTQGLVLRSDEKDRIKNEIDQVLNSKANQTSLLTKSTSNLPTRVPDSVLVQELDQLEDRWIVGDLHEFKLFERQQILNESVASLSEQVRPWIDSRLQEYKEVKGKSCDQCKEAYSFLPAKEINRRIKCLLDMVKDLDMMAASKKATRKPRAKKKPNAAKQIVKLNYKEKDDDYHVTSIQPISIIGAQRIFLFDSARRDLIEYVSSSSSGFLVAGSTLKNFDNVRSRRTKLRKPKDTLPLVLTKTAKQIEKEWKKLTTKDQTVTGRINKNQVILRAFAK